MPVTAPSSMFFPASTALSMAFLAMPVMASKSTRPASASLSEAAAALTASSPWPFVRRSSTYCSTRGVSQSLTESASALARMALPSRAAAKTATLRRLLIKPRTPPTIRHSSKIAAMAISKIREMVIPTPLPYGRYSDAPEAPARTALPSARIRTARTSLTSGRVATSVRYLS